MAVMTCFHAFTLFVRCFWRRAHRGFSQFEAQGISVHTPTKATPVSIYCLVVTHQQLENKVHDVRIFESGASDTNPTTAINGNTVYAGKTDNTHIIVYLTGLAESRDVGEEFQLAVSRRVRHAVRHVAGIPHQDPVMFRAIWGGDDHKCKRAKIKIGE